MNYRLQIALEQIVEEINITVLEKYHFEANSEENRKKINDECNSILKRFISQGDNIMVEVDGKMKEVIKFTVSGENSTVRISPVFAEI
jgi:hypothetical protein